MDYPEIDNKRSEEIADLIVDLLNAKVPFGEVDEVAVAAFAVALSAAEESKQYEKHLHIMLSRICAILVENGWYIPTSTEGGGDGTTRH